MTAKNFDPGPLAQVEYRDDGAGMRLTPNHRVRAPDRVPKVAVARHSCLRVADHLLAGAPIGRIVRRVFGYGWQAPYETVAARPGVVGAPLPDPHAA